MSDTVRKPAQRAAAESLGVLPSFTEHRLHIADGRSADGELYVVPGRSWPVDSGHRLWLRVAPVRCVVAAAVAQVDATEEGDVELGPVPMAQDDELLVVRPPCPDPHVEQALAAGGIDLLTQVPVLRGGEGQAVPVGAPQETTDIDAASGSVREHPSDFGIQGAGEAFVGVPAPVDEHQQVTIAHLRYPVVQLREIRRAMDERTHQVALGPRHATVMTRVQSGRGVSARARTQEPLCRRQRQSLPAMPAWQGLIRALSASPGGQCLSVFSRRRPAP